MKLHVVEKMLLKDPCFSKLSEIIIIILVHLKILGYIRSLSEIHYHSKMFINYFRIFFGFFFQKYQHGLHLRLKLWTILCTNIFLNGLSNTDKIRHKSINWMCEPMKAACGTMGYMHKFCFNLQKHSIISVSLKSPCKFS